MTQAVSVTRSPLGRPFALLWAGQSVSLIGDQITVLALPLLAVTYASANAFEVGVLVTLTKLPYLLIGLQAGVWVGRLGLGRAMAWADAVRGGALLLLICVAEIGGAISLLLLGACVAAIGSAAVFFQVAYQSFVPEIVDSSEQWHAANLRLSLSESISLLAGPAIGGLLIGFVSILGALVVDATTYLISITTLVVLLAITRRGRPAGPPAPEPRVTMRAAIAEGFRYVTEQPVLKALMWTGAAYNLGSAMFEAMLVLYAVKDLDMTAGQLGLAIGVGAAGFPLGGLLSGRLNRRFGRGMTLWLAGFPSVIGIAITGLATGLAAPAILAAGVFVVGVGQGAFAVNAVTLRQVHSTPEMRPRATSVHRFTSWGALPLGTLIGGLIGEHLGLRAAILVGALVAATCFVPLSARPIRTAD